VLSAEAPQRHTTYLEQGLVVIADTIASGSVDGHNMASAMGGENRRESRTNELNENE
jgi:hypothetical protein